MASATTTYNFTDEEVSHLANCNDQDDFLYNFTRILQSKGIDVTAFFDTQTTLGSSTDYGASVLTRFFENQSHALHLNVRTSLELRHWPAVQLLSLHVHLNNLSHVWLSDPQGDE